MKSYRKHSFPANKPRASFYFNNRISIQTIAIALLFFFSAESEIRKKEREIPIRFENSGSYRRKKTAKLKQDPYKPPQSKMIKEYIKPPISKTNSQNIHKILHAPDIKTLQKIIKQGERGDFLKQLCEKQKQLSRIPWSCYELHPFDSSHDPFCLKLKLKDLKIDSIKQAVALKTLSAACQKHLNFKLKVLNYRKSKKEAAGSYE